MFNVTFYSVIINFASAFLVGTVRYILCGNSPIHRKCKFVGYMPSSCGSRIAIVASIVIWTQYIRYGNKVICSLHICYENKVILCHNSRIFTQCPRNAWGRFTRRMCHTQCNHFRAGVTHCIHTRTLSNRYWPTQRLTLNQIKWNYNQS